MALHLTFTLASHRVVLLLVLLIVVVSAWRCIDWLLYDDLLSDDFVI